MECRYSAPVNSYIAKERPVVYESRPERSRAKCSICLRIAIGEQLTPPNRACHPLFDNGNHPKARGNPAAFVKANELLSTGLALPAPADIVLWKVAKITDFLVTFQVHPWIDLTFHEPVTQRIDLPGKLLQEPLFGSQRFKPGHTKRRKPYTLNHWVVGSIPTRCMLHLKNGREVAESL
jgi:hypothetical protein